MTGELSATQVEEDALKVSAEIGAPRIDNRRLADRIHRLALMNVAEKAEHRLNVLDDSAHGRRTHVLEKDLSPHRLGLEVSVQLRSQVKACPEGRCVDVEDRVFRIADSTDGPVEDLLGVCLLEVAGAMPRSHVRVAAAEDLVRAAWTTSPSGTKMLDGPSALSRSNTSSVSSLPTLMTTDTPFGFSLSPMSFNHARTRSRPSSRVMASSFPGVFRSSFHPSGVTVIVYRPWSATWRST